MVFTEGDLFEVNHLNVTSIRAVKQVCLMNKLIVHCHLRCGREDICLHQQPLAEGGSISRNTESHKQLFFNGSVRYSRRECYFCSVLQIQLRRQFCWSIKNIQHLFTFCSKNSSDSDGKGSCCMDASTFTLSTTTAE